MTRPRLIVLASGTNTGGGSGFENLVTAARRGLLDADIIAVVSNHEHGGVRERAARLGVPFIHFGEPWTAERYQEIAAHTGAEWVALSGWLKKVAGLDPSRTFNIHPALLSEGNGRFGGPSMYGHRVHEAVADALEKGEITESGVTMHFVTDMFDRGPAFFEYRVPLAKGMSAEDIQRAVSAAEHEWQPRITDMVVHKEIAWDGKDARSLSFPPDFPHAPKRA